MRQPPRAYNAHVRALCSARSRSTPSPRARTSVYAMVTAIYHRTSRVITWRATRGRISHLAANGICFLPPAAFPRLVHSILRDRARPLCPTLAENSRARMISLVYAAMTRRILRRCKREKDVEISDICHDKCGKTGPGAKLGDYSQLNEWSRRDR